eukprot:TRINITY_DN27553_c0_g1_i1.p1 TRINITY_DN27553_c0_g1~~TRINITY_DN27553_c0_g1_i1.p1  ORF type:complete len:381 (+),score=47.02 TRINITY_DN27553_c0_g1_i1:66-1208(+)
MPSPQGFSVFRFLLLFTLFVSSLRIMSGIGAVEYKSPYAMLVGFRAIGESYGLQYDLSLKKADVLVLAGDVLPKPPSDDHVPQSWYDEQYKILDSWLGASEAGKSFSHVIVIWGDHDLPQKCASCNSSVPYYTKDTVPRLKNAHVLFDETITIEGLVVYGTSWQSQNPEGAFYLPRGSQKLLDKWELIPVTTDVIVTHCPPFGMGDSTRKGRDLKVAINGNVTETLIAHELSHLAIAGMQIEEELLAPVARSESVTTISAKLKKAELNRHSKQSDGTPSSASVDKSRRQLRNTLGDALLRHVIASRKTRLIIASQIVAGHGEGRYHGIPVINPSFTDNPSAGNVLSNMLYYSKKPVFWSLYGPKVYHPQKGGMEVPFVIE